MTLALGSGGARGYAHIGIIEAIRDRGWDITGVAGTSMGALVGGLLAADELDPYAEWVRGLTQRDVLRLLDPSLRTPGALRGEKIMAEVRRRIGHRRIEDLRMPYTAVAIDLVTHREVWFQRGPLDTAVRASIALPTVFTPVMLDGRLLVDGGMLNPVPMAPLSALPSDLTIAVDLSGAPRRAPAGGSVEPVSSDESEQCAEDRASEAALAEAAGGSSDGQATSGGPGEASDSPSEAPGGRSGGRRGTETVVADWRAQLQRHLEELRESEPIRKVAGWFDRSANDNPSEAEGTGFSDLPPGLGYRDVMTMSYEAMQDAIARYREASYPADLTIRVPRDAAHTLDFHRGATMIDLGRELAEEAFAAAGY